MSHPMKIRRMLQAQINTGLDHNRTRRVLHIKANSLTNMPLGKSSSIKLFGGGAET
ncbi:hypothetical protein D3C76_1865300 [compost metagenome]